MSQSQSNSQLPIFATVAFILAGLIIGAIGGISEGSIAGGLIAGCGIFPAMWAMWAAMQQKSQGPMAIAILLCLLSLAVGGILILLRFVDWLR